MTRSSISEYTEAIRERYRKASKEGKGKILDEFTKTTGLHRKAAIRLLNSDRRPSGKKRQGQPQRYGVPVIEALNAVWEASDWLCSKRLHPFLPEMIRVMRRSGETKMSIEVESQVCQISTASIDRRLRSWKQKGGRSLSFAVVRLYN